MFSQTDSTVPYDLRGTGRPMALHVAPSTFWICGNVVQHQREAPSVNHCLAVISEHFSGGRFSTGSSMGISATPCAGVRVCKLMILWTLIPGFGIGATTKKFKLPTIFSTARVRKRSSQNPCQLETNYDTQDFITDNIANTTLHILAKLGDDVDILYAVCGSRGAFHDS